LAKTVFGVLRENLEDEVLRVKSHLAEGKAVDYATYKELCGVVRGLTHAMALITDLEQTYMDQDND
jgi:hypothetical protein